MLAEVLSELRTDLPDMASILDTIEERLSDALKRDNFRFDRGRFLRACRDSVRMIPKQGVKLEGDTRP
jgi:hypothetical protein